MPTHGLRLKYEYRPLYRARLKSLEVRVGDPHIRVIEVRDIIIFAEDERCRFKVKRIAVYATVAAMLEQEDYKKIHPHKSKAEILRVLTEIYPPERQKLGVYVFELEPA